MRIKQLTYLFILTAFAMASFNASAKSVDAKAAQAAAGKFIQQNTSAKFMSKSMSSIKLAHVEKSNVKDNAYYVFNIDGGGWIIMAGDDLAKQVLAYSDKGYIDMNELPGNMKGYLDLYKKQIEAMQSYKGTDFTIKAPKRVTPVAPLTKSTWGQNQPMDRFTPMKGGEHTAVGCAPLAMAQIMYYWKYPEGSAAMSSYYVQGTGSIPALSATTFNYDLMLDAYTIFNPATNGVALGTFTDEQADAVATLCRYAGHACEARYGNSGSSTGVYSYDQRDAFRFFGFQSDFKLIGYDPSYYCDNNNKYTEDEWKALISVELEAGRPIAYHNVDFIDGHAWVLDGVDGDGKFHMNWGFYERFNGYFEFGAFGFYPYGDSEYWNFSCYNSTANEMIINLYPYDGYVIPGGGELEVTATPVLSYDEQTRMLTVEGVGEIHVYVDGVEVEMPYKFQKTFEIATYTVTATAQEQGKAISETATLVVSVPAKLFGDINDDGFVNVADVTELINAILNSQTDSLDASVANINGDAYINVSDVTDLIAMILNH